MRLGPVIVPLLLAACAGADGGAWPSLAVRPGEIAPLVPRPEAGTAPVSAAPAPRQAVDTARDDGAARLAAIERDMQAFAARLTTQLAATARAAAAAKGTAAGSEAGAAGQLELSRLDRLGGQGTDLRDRLDALAGDMALHGEAGARLTAVGASINRLEALRTQQRTGFAAARAQLPR